MSNNIFIISGPSGAGEDSVIAGLKKILPIEQIITTTTRPMRPRESQKNPYYFISKNEFNKLIKNNNLFEYAKEYNDCYYGVTNTEIKRVQNSKKIGIWKIEYKGVIFAKKNLPYIIAILINAPLNILEKRIKNRTNIPKQYLKERMLYTKKWLQHKNIYDYEIINQEGKLNQTIKKIAKIIRTHLKNENIDKI